ncbi:hypothetical protein [Fischerella sp. PCC 9605]|uniref:hypothetical protein n=1 Tax=Fischerella sp. PCC 9605 TaxID=1173024 RepID=UPI0004798F24|nr:hypothetical protein [Fischerella sp. PCC 9605]
MNEQFDNNSEEFLTDFLNFLGMVKGQDYFITHGGGLFLTNEKYQVLIDTMPDERSKLEIQFNTENIPVEDIESEPLTEEESKELEEFFDGLLLHVMGTGASKEKAMEEINSYFLSRALLEKRATALMFPHGLDGDFHSPTDEELIDLAKFTNELGLSKTEFTEVVRGHYDSYIDKLKAKEKAEFEVFLQKSRELFQPWIDSVDIIIHMVKEDDVTESFLLYELKYYENALNEFHTILSPEKLEKLGSEYHQYPLQYLNKLHEVIDVINAKLIEIDM